MPRIDQVIAGLAAGAGRSLDVYWPPLITTFAGSAEQKMLTRVASDHTAVNPPFIWTLTSGAGASFTYVVYKNATCVRVRGGTAANAGMNAYNGSAIGLRPALGRSFIPVSRNVFGAYRVLMTAAFTAIPAADCDYGLELLLPAAGGNNLMIAGGQVPGLGFVRRPDGHVYIAIRQTVAGLLTFQDVQPFFLNFDPTEFHTYEIRLVSATATVDASASFLVDARPIATFAWGAGTVLPVYNAAYPQMQTSIKSNCENNGDLNVFGFAVQASETILGCL